MSMRRGQISSRNVARRIARTALAGVAVASALVAVPAVAPLAVGTVPTASAAFASTPPIIPVPNPLLPVRTVVNGSFEVPVVPINDFTFVEALNATVPAAGVPQMTGWQTTHPSQLSLGVQYDRPIEMVSGNLAFETQVTSADDGQQFIELNAFAPAAVYQDLCVTAGEAVTYSVAHRARRIGATNVMETTISDPSAWTGATPPAVVDYRSANQVAPTGQNDPGGWTTHTDTWAGPATTGPRRFSFSAITGTFGSTTEGNFLDDVQVSLPALIEWVDTDVARGINVQTPAADGNFYFTFAVNGKLDTPQTVEGLLGGAILNTDFTVPAAFDGAGNPSPATLTVAGNGNLEVTIPAGTYDPNDPNDYITLQVRPASSLAAAKIGSVTAVNPSAGMSIGDSACIDAGRNLLDVTVAPTGDLSISKSSSGFSEGGPITYTVTATNDAASASIAEGAVVTDIIPAGVSGATWTCAPTGAATCTANGVGNINDTVDIPVGDSVTYTVTGTASGATISNSATIAGPPTFIDVDPSNNISAVTDEVSFVCDGTFYQVATIAPDTSSRLYRVDTSTDPFTLVPIGAQLGQTLGPVGYNPIDNFIYGIDQDTGTLHRLVPDGTVSASLASLGVTGVNAGAIDDNGVFIFQSGAGGALSRVDLSDPSFTVTTVPSTAPNLADFAINPLDDQLYAIDLGGNLRRVDPTSGAVSTVATTGTALPATAFGAMSFDLDGNLFAYENVGAFWRVAIGDGTGTPVVARVSDAAASGTNDGASCPATLDAIPGVAKSMAYSGNGPWTVTLDFNVSNYGPDALENMSLPDDLGSVFGAAPTDWTLASITKTSGPASFDINPAYDGLAAGDDELLLAGSSLGAAGSGDDTASVQVVLTLNTPGTYVNQVTLTGTSQLTGTTLSDDSVAGTDPDLDGDGDPGNDSGPTPMTPTSVIPTPTYDLSITKDDGVGSAAPGSTVTYTIVATNNGPDAVDSVDVTDLFPADLTCSTTSVAAGGASGNTASFATSISERLSMPSGASVTYTSVCQISATSTGDITNTATISSPLTTPDSNPANNSATDVDTNAPAAELSITKVDTTDPIIAGDNVTYTIEVSNAGPSPATNVVVTETLPARTAAVSSAGCAEDPSASTTCTLGTIAAGSSASFTLTLSTPTDSGDDLTNTVTVTSDGSDSDLSDNTAVETTEVLLPAIAIDKTAVLATDPCPGAVNLEVVSGTQVLYCFAVTNIGDTPLTGASIEDTDLGFTGASEIAVGDLTVGQTVVVDSGAVVPTGLPNTASVAATAPNGVVVSASDIELVDVSSAGVRLNKTVSAGATCPGAETVFAPLTAAIQFCFDIENTGDSPLDLTTMQFDDPLLGIDETDLTPTTPAVAPAQLAPGAIQSYAYVVPGGLSGTQTNTASVSLVPLASDGTPLPGATTASDSDTARTEVADPSITIVKTLYRGHDNGASCPGVKRIDILPGEPVTWCMTGTNTSTTSHVIPLVTDADLDAAFPPTPGFTNTLQVVGPVPATLAPGATETVYFEDFPAATLINTGSVEGTATLPDGTPLPPPNQLGPNTDTAEVNVVNPGITFEKTVTLGSDCSTATDTITVPTGTEVTFCFTTTNSGDTALIDFVGEDPAIGAVGANAFVAAGPLLPGDSVTIAERFVVTDDLLNVASIEAQPASLTGAPLDGIARISDTDDATVVVPIYDLAITKDDGVTIAVPGASVTYTIVASNAGPDDVSGVQVDDVIPAGLTCATTSVAAGGATGNTATINGDIAETIDLPAGASVTYTSVCDVALTATGPIINTATITSPLAVPDQDLSNNTASDSDAIGAEAGLSVTKSDDIDPLVAGETVTYTITVTNAGPSIATNVLATETLPAGVTLVSTSGCVQDPVGAPACSLGDIGVNDTASYTLAVSTPINVGDDLVNTVDITSDSGDADLSDNQAVEATEVLAPSVDIVATAVLAGDPCPGVAGTALEVQDGSMVEYCFEVTNTGETPLTGVEVDVPLIGVTGATALAVADLPVGGSATVVAGPLPAVDISATANVTATPTQPGGGAAVGAADVGASDTDTVDVRNPGVTIAKTVSATGTCPGSESVFGSNGAAIRFCFDVTNIGDASLDLANMTFTDATLGIDATDLVPTVPAAAPAALLPGATQSFEYVVPAGLTATATNTASISIDPLTDAGAPLPGGTPVTDDDTASTELADPAIAIVKTAYSGFDAGAGCPGTNLLYGLSGFETTYCIQVTNTSSAAYTRFEVVDTDLQASFPVSITQPNTLIPTTAVPDTLAPGDTITLYLEVASSADLVNTATVTAIATDVSNVPIVGDPVVPPASDIATVDVVGPAVSLAKTVVAGTDCTASTELVSVTPGTDITYCFEVTNSGDTSLTGVQILDPDAGADVGSELVVPGPIAAGGTAMVSQTVAATVDVVNTATVSAVPADATGAVLPGIDPVTADDTAEVDVVTPDIELVKTVYRGHDAGASCPGVAEVALLAGDAATYCFVVTNTGDTFMNPVVVDDTVLGVTLSAPVPLAPGDSVTLFTETTVDVTVPNNASVTGTPSDPIGNPLGPPPVGPKLAPDAPVGRVVEPGSSLTKSVYVGHDGGASCPGTTDLDAVTDDAVTYCFEVLNTGDTHLSGIAVTDAQLGVTVDTDTVLAPGESVMLFTETNVGASGENLASSTATPSNPDGTPNGLPAITTDLPEGSGATVATFDPAIAISTKVTTDLDCADPVELVQVKPDTRVTFCFTVTNTGDVPLIDVEIRDVNPATPLAALQFVTLEIPGVLAPGASVEVSYPYNALTDLLNEATASGQPADDAGDARVLAVVSSSDPAEVDIINPSFDIEIAVYQGDGGAAGCAGAVTELMTTIGTTLTVCITITNTGDVPLTDIVIDDPGLGISGLSIPGPIGVGESVTVTTTVEASTETLTSMPTGTSAEGADSATTSDTSVTVSALPETGADSMLALRAATLLLGAGLMLWLLGRRRRPTPVVAPAGWPPPRI